MLRRFVIFSALVLIGGDWPSAGKPAHAGAPSAALRFAKYNQPSAYHADFWQLLDLELLEADLALLKSDGFNGLAVPLPFGTFVTSVDDRGFSIDEAALQSLRLVLEAAERHALVTVLWLNDHRLPAGVSGTSVARYTDPAGREHAAFQGYYADGLAVGFEGDHRWRAFLGFCAAVARVASGHSVLWDPLDWQWSVIHPFQLADEELLAAWRRHLRAIEPDAVAWGRRWDTPIRLWDEVLLPHSQGQLDAIEGHLRPLPIRTEARARRAWELYGDLPPTPPTSAHWRDFGQWRESVRSRLWSDVVSTLRAAGSGPIGLRIDTDHRAGVAAVRAAPEILEQIDLLFYPVHVPVTDPAALERRLDDLASTTGRPVVLWETLITEPAGRRESWAAALELADRLGVGLGLWAWRDNYFNFHTDRGNGLRAVDGTLKTDP